jgi:type VI secretion system protein ImpB
VAKQSSQKFIARNRAPRVQIEYDVEVYGSQKKVQLPFVMGVMADLSGKPATPLPAVADRKFLEIDIDNFDQRLKAMMPRVAFAVPNTLTGEGNLQVDLTFESMDDFSPAAIAKKVEPLRKLLETRTQLSNLMTYMDGKSGAEELVGKMLRDPALLQSLGSTPNPAAAAQEEKPTGGEDDKENLDSLLDEMK